MRAPAAIVAGLVLAGGLLAAAPAADAAPVQVPGVTVAQVGNELLLAGTDYGNFELVYYQPVGSSTWSTTLATEPGTVYSRVSIADLTESMDGRRVIHLIAMVAEGPDQTVNFWWEPLSQLGSGPWHQETLGFPGTDVSVPSIVQVGNRVAIAAQGSHGEFSFFFQQIGTTGWFSSYTPNVGIDSAPAMTPLGTNPDMVGMAFAGNIYTTYRQWLPFLFGQDWNGSELTPARAGSRSAPAITGLSNGGTAIITQGADHSLYYWTTTSLPAFTFTGDAFPGTVYSDVSMAVLNGGVMAAAAYGINDNVNFYWRSPGGGPWHIEELGYAGTDQTPPQVIAVTNGGIHLVAVATEGPNGSADLYWQNVGSSTWQDHAFPDGTFTS